MCSLGRDHGPRRVPLREVAGELVERILGCDVWVVRPDDRLVQLARVVQRLLLQLQVGRFIAERLSVLLALLAVLSLLSVPLLLELLEHLDPLRLTFDALQLLPAGSDFALGHLGSRTAVARRAGSK